MGNMTMTSFPGSTFSWQSNIYTYAFIYYNLHPVPKGGGGLGSSVPVPCCPCLVSHIAPRRSYHHPPASSWQLSTSSRPSSSTFHLPTATESRPIIKKVLPLCYFSLYHTHNRLIFSLVSPWVRTPQGSHAHFAVHLVRFSVMWCKILPFVVQSPPPCGIKSPPMWYNLCLHATSRTNPEPIPKEGEAMKTSQRTT